jgi:DNA-binding transcriptional regulator YiaG
MVFIVVLRKRFVLSRCKQVYKYGKRERFDLFDGRDLHLSSGVLNYLAYLKKVTTECTLQEESKLKKRGSMAQFLKEKRMKIGLTQSDVARKLGYSSPQFVSNWERGLASPPVFILRDLTKIYKVSADEMFKLLLSEVEADLRTEFYSTKKGRR